MKQALPTVWSYPCPGVLVGFVFISTKQLIFLPEAKWSRSVYHQEFSAGQSLWMHAMQRTPWRVYIIQGSQFMTGFLRGVDFRKGCVMASHSLQLLQIRGCCWGFKLFSQYQLPWGITCIQLNWPILSIWFGEFWEIHSHVSIPNNMIGNILGLWCCCQFWLPFRTPFPWLFL